MKNKNYKKIICIILTIALMFSLVSCGNVKEYKGKPGEGAVKVGVILQGSIDDAGFNQSCYEMCQALEKNIDGLTVLRKENVPETSEAETVMYDYSGNFFWLLGIYGELCSTSSGGCIYSSGRYNCRRKYVFCRRKFLGIYVFMWSCSCKCYTK